MRKILAVVAVCAASVVPGLALAAPSLASQPRTCTVHYGAQVLLGSSKTWISSYSGCAAGYPIQYNRTACIYRNVVGTFWYSGPVRKGTGSSSSNYSGVTCNQFPFPSVVQVWIWVNEGSGWGGKRVF